MKKTLIYIANYLSEEIMAERNNKAFYSPAANNKIIGIAKSLETQGYKVYIVAPSLSKNNTLNKFPSRSETFNENIEIIHVKGLDLNVLNRFYSIFSEMKVIASIVKNNDVKAIIFYDFLIETAISALISKLLYSEKIYVDYEEDLYSRDYPFSFYRFLLLFLRKFAARYIDGAILVTTNLSRYIRAKKYKVCRGFYKDFGDEEVKTIVNKNENVDMQAHMNDVPTMTFSGKMDEFRGMNLLLAAIKDIKYKCKLCITGYGPDLERFRELAKLIKSDLVEVDFKGFVSEKDYKELVMASDILINTQLINTESSQTLFPSKIIEYMSTGNIVISSNISDISIIAEGRVILYYKDTPQDIAETINKVLNNLDNYRDYGKAAKEYCKENFSYEKYGKEFAKLF